MSYGSRFYQVFIDPLTRGLRREVIKNMGSGSRVLDIACGTGALAFELATVAGQVTGIDLDQEKIRYGQEQARKNQLDHVRFLVADASQLENLFREPFDFAILSLAIHQFPEQLRYEILRQAIKISRNLVLADYTVPRPNSPSGLLSLTLEILAGKEHYRAYRTYLACGGLPGIADQLNLVPYDIKTAGNGVFTVLRLANPVKNKDIGHPAMEP